MKTEPQDWEHDPVVGIFIVGIILFLMIGAACNWWR